jgi:hypothetical protein
VGIVASARDGAIERGLAALGYELAWLPFQAPADFVERVVAFAPGVVLNLGVGRLADDAARALEVLGVAYTGSTPLAVELARDSALRGAVLRAHGLPTAGAGRAGRALTLLLLGNGPETEARLLPDCPAVPGTCGAGSPAPSAEPLARARALGLAAARALRCRDHARVELDLDADGEPRVRAVATDLPALADRWGSRPAELADRLIQLVAATPLERRAYQRV